MYLSFSKHSSQEQDNPHSSALEDALDTVMVGRTTLVIAHRLSARSPQIAVAQSAVICRSLLNFVSEIVYFKTEIRKINRSCVFNVTLKFGIDLQNMFVSCPTEIALCSTLLSFLFFLHFSSLALAVFLQHLSARYHPQCSPHHLHA